MKTNKNPLLNRYSLIIFDFDGTLCDTRNTIKYAMNETFKYFNFSIPNQTYLQKLIGTGTTLEKTIMLLHVNGIDEYQVQKWARTYRKIYSLKSSVYTRLFDGVEEVLLEAKRCNIKSVIISNKESKAIEDSLRLFKIFDLVSLVIGGDHPLEKKPDPMTYNMIIKKQFDKATTNSVLMVGDTVTDIKYAKNCEIDCAWVTYGYGGSEECKAENPDYIISHLKELQENGHG